LYGTALRASQRSIKAATEMQARMVTPTIASALACLKLPTRAEALAEGAIDRDRAEEVGGGGAGDAGFRDARRRRHHPPGPLAGADGAWSAGGKSASAMVAEAEAEAAKRALANAARKALASLLASSAGGGDGASPGPSPHPSPRRAR